MKKIEEKTDTTSVVSSRNTSANTKTYLARTSLKLPFDMGLRTSAKIENTGRRSSSVYDSTKVYTFPDITLNWNKLEDKIPYLKSIFTNMNLNSSFTKNSNKNWQNNEKKSDKIEKKYSPSLNTKIIKKVDFSFSYTFSNQENKDYSGKIVSTSFVDTKGITTTLRYTFSPKSLPFFKNSKLKSNINLTTEYKTNDSKTRRQVGDETIALIQDNQSNSVSFNADYGFSQKFRGGARMLFSNTKDITKKVHKVNEVSVWCELKF